MMKGGRGMMIVQSHVYSEYSLLSSTNRIEALVEKASRLGYQALALCDHHVMYGAVPFYQACLKYGIKPILGLELTIQRDEDEPHTLALIRLYAKNEQGYAHLMQLATLIGHKEEKHPALSREEVIPYLNDLVVVLPDQDGPIHSWLQSGQDEKAREWLATWRGQTNVADWLLGISGNNEQVEQVSLFSKQNGLKVIASHPCYFLEERDAEAFGIARAIRDGVKAEDRALRREERSYFLQSPEQMLTCFKHEREALENTQLLASLCSVQLTLGQPQLPKYTPAEGESNELLRQLCVKGAHLRYREVNDQVRERLEKELHVITQMGFSDYFLIVWDFMRYARKQGMLTGPGRGSAAGSLVAYVLEITNVDPLKYNLLFERFLNHERVSMPDIDIDFPDHRRDEVIEYVQGKYGKEHVAQIITFGTLAARAVVRDVGKALGLMSFVIEQVAREIPSTPGMTLEKALAESKRLAALINESDEAKALWQIAKQLEGLPKHTSTHAAGVVISARPLPEIVALQAGQAGVSLTQATMNVIEELGLLKFDFLGLRNLTLLERMVSLIEEHNQVKLDLQNIPLNDEETFVLLGKGDTTGVFQLESPGMRRTLTHLKPTEFEDIVAVNALYRPGPMEFIQTYIDGKYKVHTITYAHPDLEPILKGTHGVIVYQEQIMQIASLLAGFSLAEADILRRAISKKKKEELARQREAFVKGAVDNGYEANVAIEVFSLIERFADYGFNRSHAVAYSMISYQLAYVKAHYPLAFYTALFSSVWHNHEKLAHHLRECRSAGYKVLPPSVSHSDLLFSIENKAIRFGLLPITHVGVQAVEAIISERKKKPFEDLFSFTVRFDQKIVNKKSIEQLIKAGAMDEFRQDRATLLKSLDEALRFAIEVKEFQEETGGLFTLDIQAPEYDQAEPLLIQEKLEYEKEALGFYLSGHPIETYKAKLADVTRVTIETAFTKTGIVRVAGLIVSVRKIKTKKGEPMAFAVLSDESQEGELILFPQAWQKVEITFKEGELVLIEGRMDQSKERKQIIVEKVVSVNSLSNEQGSVQDAKLFLRITPAREHPKLLQQVKQQLLDNKGQVPVVLYYEQTKQTKRLLANYNVSPSNTCLSILKELLGKENVVLRKEGTKDK